MTQQLSCDFAQPPTSNPDYFIPLNLTLDPEEKARFIKNGLVGHKDAFSGTGRGLAPVEFDDTNWTKTITKGSRYLSKIGLKVRCITIFVSDSNVTSWVVHKDGARNTDGSATLLEARLAFYEISDAPGVIRWWTDESMPTTLIDYPVSQKFKLPARITCLADCANDLLDNATTWDNIAQPVFSTVTSCPSAIVRTNLPHHVIQGNGFRATIGCQIVFMDGQINGVWEHIQRNVHLLGPQ